MQRLLGRVVMLAVVAVHAAAQAPVFTPFHENGTYGLGERAGWTVTGTGRFAFEIRQNNVEVLRKGELDLSSGSGAIEITRQEPGMLYAEVTAPNTTPIHVGAAIAPTQLQPSVPRPADFDAFWDAKLKDLAAIPINPQLTPAATEKPGVELYTVRLDSVGSNVQGYLAKPAREGKFPALVVYQYAGIYALNPATSTDRAAEGWLVFNVDSHDMHPTQATGAPANYQAVGNTSRETSYFLNMYLRDARAVDYIRSRPDWDGKTIALMGTSMGGQQSLVTAGLRPDVTAVMVNVPSGADSNGNLHGSRAGYPNWNSSDPRVMETALYFDTVNFAARIKAPVLAAIGYIDTISPPHGIWRAMNQIPGRKDVIPMVESDHDNRTPEKQGEWRARSREWLEILRTTAAAPR